MKELKIAVISDSHDNIHNLAKAVGLANRSGCSHLFHLGDIVAPFAAAKLADFKGEITGVFGNNDGEKLGLIRIFNSFSGTISPAPKKLELNSKRILLLHEPHFLTEIVKSGNYDYVFYGHLHQARLEKTSGTNVLNPGETGGWTENPSFYIINLNDETFEKIDL